MSVRSDVTQPTFFRAFFKRFRFLMLAPLLLACGTLEVKVEGIAAQGVLEVNVEAPTPELTPTPPASTPSEVVATLPTSPPTATLSPSPTPTVVQTPTSISTPSPTDTPPPTTSPTPTPTVQPSSTPTAISTSLPSPTPVILVVTATPVVTVSSAASSQPPLAVAAPTLVEHDGQVFRWKWVGAESLGNADWYFDIKLYEGAFAATPYDVLVAEQRQTIHENNEWRFEGTSNFRCDSYWAVQIANRNPDGAYAGPLSPESNRLQVVGPACGDGGGSGEGGSGPTTTIE